MQDDGAILLTAEGNNGKIELTETSVRYTEYKKELLKWNKSRISKVHEILREAIISAEVSSQNEFNIFLPGDFPGPEFYKRFTVSFKEEQRPEFENIAEEIGLQGRWYENDSKLSNVVSYSSEEQASIDANKAAKRGWMPQSTSTTDGHTNIGRTVAKTILTGGVGLAVLGASRTAGKVTINYARTPEWLERRRNGTKDLDSNDAALSPPKPSDPDDVIAQLERLAKLKEQGILTEDELQTQKKKILGA